MQLLGLTGLGMMSMVAYFGATAAPLGTGIAFAGTSLPAGAYRVYAIPYADHWVLALNSEAGAFGYSPPDYDNDVLRIRVPVQRLESSLEQFTIDFLERDSRVILRLRWDTTAVEIQIEDKSDPEKATVLASKKNERR